MRTTEELKELSKKLEITVQDELYGFDCFIPFINKVKEDGASFFFQIDGERNGSEEEPSYTIFITSKKLENGMARKDTNTMEEGIAKVILEYANQIWS